MTVRIEPTPIAASPVGDLGAALLEQQGRRYLESAAAALLGVEHFGRGAIDALLTWAYPAVTTGQQAGLFTGPLYSVMKGISAAAMAAELAVTNGMPATPVFWVPGDDHDFAEINHASVIGADGQLVTFTLRSRAPDAPMLPAFREPVGPEVAGMLAALRAALPDGPGRDQTMDWLATAYLPSRSLAEAYAHAMAALLGPFGVAVCRGWDGSLKRAAQPVLMAALEHAAELDKALAAHAERLRAAGLKPPIEVGDSLSLVMIEGKQGRDRLKINPDGSFTTRRSGETFTLDALHTIMEREPERLSANVLLRGAVESFVIPTVAYMGGPGELAYIAQSAPAHLLTGSPRSAALPRFSALLIDPKVDKILGKHGLTAFDLARPEGELASAIARDALDPAAAAALEQLRGSIESGYAAITRHALAVDPTLEKTVLGARNQALAGSHDIEKKLVSHLKKKQEVTLAQVERARAQLYPGGKPQERVVTAASFLARYGFDLLKELYDAARVHARRYLVAAPVRS